jgi:hypothetical protein
LKVASLLGQDGVHGLAGGLCALRLQPGVLVAVAAPGRLTVAHTHDRAVYSTGVVVDDTGDRDADILAAVEGDSTLAFLGRDQTVVDGGESVEVVRTLGKRHVLRADGQGFLSGDDVLCQFHASIIPPLVWCVNNENRIILLRAPLRRLRTHTARTTDMPTDMPTARILHGRGTRDVDGTWTDFRGDLRGTSGVLDVLPALGRGSVCGDGARLDVAVDRPIALGPHGWQPASHVNRSGVDQPMVEA